MIDFYNTLHLSLLNKLDRCSMLKSVESRSPFLSKEVIEFANNNLNSSDLVNSKNKKIFLKKFSKKFLPSDFDFDRKQVFSFPFDEFLKRPAELSKIKSILTSKESIFDEYFINWLLKLASKSIIRYELIFILLKIKIWKNKYSIRI